MNKLSYGLFVVTAKNEEKQNGCITNTVMQVTTTPNVISLAVNKQNYTHDLILKSKEFNVSIISEKAKFDLFKHFGFQSGRAVDKFADFTEFKVAENGIYYITKGTNAVICAKVKDMIDLGVTSFKLEGRMRSIYYIATVILTYRKIIDKINNFFTKFKIIYCFLYIFFIDISNVKLEVGCFVSVHCN